jgi:hypothetical protein
MLVATNKELQKRNVMMETPLMVMVAVLLAKSSPTHLARRVIQMFVVDAETPY